MTRYLANYFAQIDASPPLPNGARFDEATGRVEHLTAPRVGSATGFAIYLGRSPKELLALRDKYPEAFGQCIEDLRKHISSRATCKKFAEMITSRPLLDLRRTR
ncbi:hypothetical protein [Pararhodobacter sp. CCB-MM2]|uniref:hypothetical protein n=1 Tax=Pararhodobacter sp. CCB-MM2 TaxID=1786003 RepID=UPI001111C444|nr:hypothetical protein [Pararhodobacter sp. CCB-MM2]